jgi:hypothetical protein
MSEQQQLQTMEGQAEGAGSILETIDRRMCDLEKQLARILATTSGVCMSDTATAIESAVRRAQTKAKMFGDRIVCVPELVLAALDEIEAEIVSLPKVTEVNASIMRGVQHSEEAGGSESTQTARGTTASGYNESEKKVSQQKGSTEGGYTSDPGLSPKFQTGSRSDTENGTSSSSGTGNNNSSSVAYSAATLMKPLRRLVDEAKHSLKVPKVLDARKTVHLSKADSRELRIAQDVDFDVCESPKVNLNTSSRHKRGNGSPTSSASSPRIFGHCIAYGIDAAGNPVRVEPLAAHVDQYKPMLSPLESPSIGKLNQLHISPHTSGHCESAVPPGLYTGALVSGKEGETAEDSARCSGRETFETSYGAGADDDDWQTAERRVPQEVLGPRENHNAILVERGV